MASVSRLNAGAALLLVLVSVVKCTPLLQENRVDEKWGIYAPEQPGQAQAGDTEHAVIVTAPNRGVRSRPDGEDNPGPLLGIETWTFKGKDGKFQGKGKETSDRKRRKRDETNARNTKSSRLNGRATRRKPGLGSDNEPPKPEQRPSNSAGRKTEKQPERLSSSSRPSKADESSRDKKGNLRPRPVPRNRTQTAEGRARRPRDLSSQDSVAGEDVTKPSIECSGKANSTKPQDTESVSAPAEQPGDEPDGPVRRSARTPDDEPTEPSPGEDEEATEVPEVADSSGDSEHASDRRRRHVQLQEVNIAEGRNLGGFSEIKDVEPEAALRRSKRQQMGFLHYRRPNRAFTGKPYTGRPWPEVLRRPNQRRL